MAGGGPASGKSTVLKSGLVDVPAKGQAVVVNADDIKEMLPENPRMRKSKNDGDFFRAAEFTHEESSILAKRLQNRAIKNNQDIVLDGTGDSSINKLARKINEARDAGYKVNAVYVSIPTEMAWERSQKRALGQEKRYVPEYVVRGTHRDVSQTFPLAVQGGIFDTVSLWDNSGSSIKLIGSGSGSNFNVSDNSGYEAFLAKGA
jgi:predicted ABC-type ATPase